MTVLGEGNGNPLQYSCLENPVDRGAWWAAIYGVAQSQMRLKWLSMHACIGEGNGNPLQCSCLENPRDGGAWWAAVYGVAQSRTQLKQVSSSIRKLIHVTKFCLFTTQWSEPVWTNHVVNWLVWLWICLENFRSMPRNLNLIHDGIIFFSLFAF